MMKRSTAGLVAVTWLFGTLACAGGSANEDDTAAAPQQDTAQATEPPPGYSGMEQDTTGAEHQPTAVDTFLNEQGTGVPTDTAGYGGLEHQDTSAAAAGDIRIPANGRGLDRAHIWHLGLQRHDRYVQHGHDRAAVGPWPTSTR